MSVFKCKMCGGTIEFSSGDTVGVCDSCGTKQTLPRLDDDKKANLYDRANHFRRSNDFDKAMSIYGKILNEDSTDAEAYWSLVLCRYGIEYVEDPSTHKRIPTVNRAQYTSIFADEDFKSALQYADASQRELYESEATAIDNIQKGILEISRKEEPFDVFICYKETDNSGRRTQDSVLANDLYHQLTQEGFKVFFSRITLEDKLGTAYEPYIFAALNSAKVMVVIGTKPEYFNAVWVKNEWSRYLALIRGGAKKILIPAYRDMDPYDLPEDFSHLQAQDMSKLGFMQDLIRGIKKITAVDESKQVVKQTIVSNVSTNIQPLLKRVFMFLEDGEFDEADEYCEKILDIDPECAQAYLGKLMAELKVRKQENLIQCEKPFDDNNNYSKIIRFGDKELTEQVNNYIEEINKRCVYEKAVSLMNKALNTVNRISRKTFLKEAIQEFEKIKGFKDSEDLIEKCNEEIGSWQDDVYYRAKDYMSSSILTMCQKALNDFKSIPGWKDADQLMVECETKISELERKEEEARAAAEREIEAQKRKVKRKRKLLIASLVVICLAIVATIMFIFLIKPMLKYNKAVTYFDNGEYMEARKIFYEMYDYKDSKTYFDQIYCVATKEVYTSSDGSVSTNEYTYDSNGNMMKKVTTRSDGGVSTSEYTYDSNGNMIKEVWTESGGSVITYEQTYDLRGNETKSVKTYSDGSVDIAEYSYDSNGNMTKRIYTYSDGSVDIAEYTYDSNGNMIKEVDTDSDDGTETYEYTLDSEERLIKRVYTNSNGEQFINEIVYNKYGQFTEQTYESIENDGHSHTVYEYNNDGIMTKAVEVDSNEGRSTTEYSDYVYFKKDKNDKNDKD